MNLTKRENIIIRCLAKLSYQYEIPYISKISKNILFNKLNKEVNKILKDRFNKISIIK
jgi:hypothetical protein